MNPNSDIATITDSEFDDWYNNGNNSQTPQADDLLGGQKPGEEQETRPSTGDDQPKPPASSLVEDLPVMDEDEEEGPLPASPKGGGDATGKAVVKTGEAPATPAEPPAPTGDLYKSLTEYLVGAGKWADFDGREEMEFTDENFSQLVERQDEHRLESRWTQKLGQLGPYGQAIMEFEQNGGNPAELIEHFRAQQDAQASDIETPDGQKQFIRSYYRDIGRKDTWITKHLNMLEMAGDEHITEEAKELKTEYDALHQGRIAKAQEQQQEYARERAKREQDYRTSITKAITGRKDLSDEQKQYYVDMAVNYDQPLPDGRVVNKAYMKFAQIQSEPELYSLFLQFVDDPKKFIQATAQEGADKNNKKVFSLLNGNGNKQIKKASAHVNTSAQPGFSFKDYLNT